MGKSNNTMYGCSELLSLGIEIIRDRASATIYCMPRMRWYSNLHVTIFTMQRSMVNLPSWREWARSDVRAWLAVSKRNFCVLGNVEICRHQIRQLNIQIHEPITSFPV